MAIDRRPARWVATGVVVILVVAGAAAIVLWRANDRTAGPENAGLDCPLTVPARGRPLLAAPGVHRVMLVGDSIMLQASCAIADSLAGLGITTTREAVPGSGLLRGIDWVTSIGPLLAAHHPDAVIVIFVGNALGPPIPGVAGAAGAPGTDEFRRAWQARAEALSRTIHAAGADVYWVSPPPFALPPFVDAAKLYAGYRKIPGDHAIDAGRSLAGAHGEVVRLRTCGRVRTVRAADGAHLTPDGARIYGQTIARDFGRDVGLRTSPAPC
jgi:hypothetical protein